MFVSGANRVPRTYYRLKTYPLSEMPPVGMCTAAFSGRRTDILFTALCLGKQGCQAIRDSRLILMAFVKWNLWVNSQQGLNRTPLLPPDSTRRRVIWKYWGWGGGDLLCLVTSPLELCSSVANPDPLCQVYALVVW